jgi:hypothetical protein
MRPPFIDGADRVGLLGTPSELASARNDFIWKEADHKSMKETKFVRKPGFNAI